MPFAAALSEHPVSATATGEAVGQVLDTIGEGPDLATIFVTPHHAGALEDIASAMRTLLKPGTLVGCAAVSVLANGREVEDGPAVAVWAGHLDAPVTPVRLEVTRLGDSVALRGWPEAELDPDTTGTLLLLADPFSFPAEAFFANLPPGLRVVGGNASAARGPGGNHLLLDDRIERGGAVGALIGAGTRVEPVVSQGCRPVGFPYAVTRAERNLVYELGGMPAYERLVETASGLDPAERELLQHGVFLGVVVDEHKADYGRGDFLVRNLLDADQATGAVAVGDLVEVGTTAQYHVRDATSADEDLRHLLGGRQADGALMFTCNGRGTHLFDGPHHDATVVAETLDEPATAGFFAAGEFGPVGRRNFVHSHTASIALWRESAG